MARVRALAAALLLASAAAAAHADPISIIGGLITYFGAEAAGVVLSEIAFAGVTYGALAFAAGSLVFGTINARNQKRRAESAAKDQYNANLSDRLVTALATGSPWQIIYGQAEVGGSLEAMLTSGDKDQFKHLVIVLAAHLCEAIVDIKINGESIGDLDGAGNVTGGKWFKGSTTTYSDVVTFDGAGTGHITRPGGVLVAVVIPGQTSVDSYIGDTTFPGAALTGGTTVTGGPAGMDATVTYTLASDASLVRVQKHLGADDQVADATLLAECPDTWTATDRLQGLCYIVVRLNLSEPEFDSGPPNITAVVKGKQVYDHRDGTTAWKDNPALCVADFLRSPYGKNARDNQLVWATVDAAANACDEHIFFLDIPLLRPRFTCNGAFTTDQGTDDVLEQLLTAMAGWADCSGGWRIGAGVWTTPVTTLTVDDNAGAVQITGGAALDELFNGVRGQFNDPTKYGVATDYPSYQNASFLAADGRELWSDITLPFTDHSQRAVNLARIFTEQARGETLSFPAKMAVVNRVKVGERLWLDIPLLGINGLTFRLTKREESPGTGLLLLTLQEDYEANYDLADAVIDVPPSPNGAPDPFAVPTVIGLSADSGDEYSLVTTTSVVPRIFIAVTGQPQYVTDLLQLQWRTSADDTWQTLDVPQGQMSAYINNVVQGVVYFVQARWFRPSVNTYGDWRVVMVTAVTKSTAPAAFDVFTVTEEATGMRLYTFAYTTTPVPADWVGAEIRMIAGTYAVPTWSAMTPLANSGTYFTASPVESSAPTSLGTYTFACRSRDSGALSPMKVATVTFGTVPPDVYVPDTTPPPAPTGVTVTAALTHLFITEDTPTYAQGHGHLRTNLYGKLYTGGALPTFADAALVAQFTGTALAFPVNFGEAWRLWLKWESVDGVEGAAAGGTNGYSGTSGVIGTTDLGPLIVTAAKLAAGAIDLTKFASGLTGVEIVAALPSTGNFEGRVVYLTTDDKVYRYNGAAWTKSTDGADILAGTVVANSIAAGAITAVKLAANAIAVGTAAIQNGAIVNAMIGNLAVDSAKIANAAVDSLQIQGSAVTVPTFGATSVDLTLSLLNQSVVLTFVSTGGVAPEAIFVNAAAQINPASGSPTALEYVKFSLWRDSTMLIETDDVTTYGNESYLFPMSWCDLGGLSAGTTYTYYLKARRTGPSGNAPVVGGATIFAIGTKR